MANFGTLTTEIGSGVWLTPANFNRFRVLQRYCTTLQQRASAKLCGVAQGMELRKFRRGRHLYSAGRPSRWASAHILVGNRVDYLRVVTSSEPAVPVTFNFRVAVTKWVIWLGLAVNLTLIVLALVFISTGYHPLAASVTGRILRQF